MPSIVIPELKHVKLEDGTYAIVLPITTVDQVYYDVKNKITMREKLSQTVGDKGGELTGGLSYNFGDVLKRFYDITAFNMTNETHTGILTVNLPKFYDNSLISVEVSALSIATKNSWKILASCVLDADTQTCKFSSVRVDGTGPFKEVYFADNGNNICLMIGEETSEWENICLYIDSVTVVNNTIDDGWREGYTVSFLDSVATVSNMQRCYSLNSGKIEIKTNNSTLTTNETEIEFIGGSIDVYDNEYDTLQVFMNGVLLAEDIHYEISGNKIIAKDEFTFYGSTEEPLLFEFKVIKNSKS